MARDAKDLRKLVDELASLAPEERAKVIAEASRRTKFHPPLKGWTPPVLTGAKLWDAGNLSREELYDDDGR